MGPWRSKYETTFAHDNENRPTTLTYQNAGQTAYTYDGIGDGVERPQWGMKRNGVPMNKGVMER